jgi:serine/threonine-protein kinase LATS1/2
MASGAPPRLMRKASNERELPQSLLPRNSPALDSGAGSSRSNSPYSSSVHSQMKMRPSAGGPMSSANYSNAINSCGDLPPPPLPPRCSSTPSTPPPLQVQHQLFKRRSPATTPTRSNVSMQSPSPARGTSPVTNPTQLRPPFIVPNGPDAQHQLNQQYQAIYLYTNGSLSVNEPPPPYPFSGNQESPPSYTAAMQNRQSPTQSYSDYRKSPSSGIYSGTSAGSPSPITVSQPAIPFHSQMARPVPLPPWSSARQTRTQHPIIMQSVKSTQVQKPVLQTVITPTAPSTSKSSVPSPSGVATGVCVGAAMGVGNGNSNDHFGKFRKKDFT